MIKALVSSTLLSSLLALSAGVSAKEQWQLTDGELVYQTQLVSWQQALQTQCQSCELEVKGQTTQSGQVTSHRLWEGDTVRALKVSGNKSWISIPNQDEPVKLKLLHKKDGSLMVLTPRGAYEHLELHQTNYLEVKGGQYALWLDGYNPASRNWRYDSEHDAPAIKYTLLAL